MGRATQAKHALQIAAECRRHGGWLDGGQAAFSFKIDACGGSQLGRQAVVRRGDDQKMLVVKGHDAHQFIAQSCADDREIAQALTGGCRHQALDPDRDLIRLPG